MDTLGLFISLIATVLAKMGIKLQFRSSVRSLPAAEFLPI